MLANENKTKVLIVDDDTAFSFLIAETLLKHDFEVAETHSGIESCEKLTSIAPDMIILDVLKPEQDGYETCHTIRQRAQFKQTPILMMTRLDDELAAQSSYLAGATGYIGKPFAFKAFLYLVNNMLKNSEQTIQRAINEQTA